MSDITDLEQSIEALQLTIHNLGDLIARLQNEVHDLERKVEYDCAKDYELNSVKSDVHSLENRVTTLEYRT